ncbi:TetR/AcrR family transcriptional regulator [Synechococcus sp. PCC 7336]|uniref:TetR/AcrR family transcriptional regulator n=1 Tax=Synechococcus sp. PCC 7336 TaxID=195250 RepID=UPI00034B7173|nr:TetR/AcrR family transcriptional regulator [Synechococcus sp. PCC 7336]
MGRPRRSQNNREKLLNCGANAFIKQGYHGTGIQEVVERVRVPKGSFYNYFESKEGFGAEVIRQYTQQYVTNMDALLSEPNVDALSALKYFFEAEIQRHEAGREGCLLGNLGAELGESSELCRQALSEGLQTMQQRFRLYLVMDPFWQWGPESLLGVVSGL